MTWEIVSICGGFSLFVVALWLASKNGSKSAQLEALKQEIKKQAEEQRRAQQIADGVYSLSADECRRRLHDVANDQRKRM